MAGNNLNAHEIIRVLESLRDGTYHQLRYILASGDAQIPDGHFAFHGGKLYLPKRKRGHKFLVTFTEVREIEI